MVCKNNMKGEPMATKKTMNINANIDKILIIDPGKNTVNVLCLDSNFSLIGNLAFPSVTQKKRSFKHLKIHCIIKSVLIQQLLILLKKKMKKFTL